MPTISGPPDGSGWRHASYRHSDTNRNAISHRHANGDANAHANTDWYRVANADRDANTNRNTHAH